jgi:phosphopantetheinyl transferase
MRPRVSSTRIVLDGPGGVVLRAVVCPPGDQGRFATQALAIELGVPVTEVVIRRDARGKPLVERPDCDLALSISHTRGVTVVAFARGVDLGVDVERIDRAVIEWALWRHVLTPLEMQRLPSSRDARTVALLQSWVSREAVLKAAGVGLAVDPRDIELTPEGRIVALAPSLGVPSDWVLTRIALEGFVAAVACRLHRERSRERDSDGDRISSTVCERPHKQPLCDSTSGVS